MNLPVLPPQPDDLPWPTDGWATGGVGPGVDQVGLDHAIAAAFEQQPTVPLAWTDALVVVHGSRIVRERYGPETDADTTLLSWSMAKSVLHALVGLAVSDGLLDPGAAAPVAEWPGPDDPRSSITVEHLLRMCSGLKFREDYVDDQQSDVIEMLFGPSAPDMGRYAADFPLVHEPGTVFNYSSGTSNIVARIMRDLHGGREAVRERLARRLFDPIGMSSATARFDKSGTFVGSSYVYATARDFARFGLLYLRGGTVDGREVLPAWWIDHARTPTPLATGAGEYDYGAHWWLTDPAAGVFHASGYEGQRIVVAPDRDLVIVRLGRTPADLAPNLNAFVAEVLDCFQPR